MRSESVNIGIKTIKMVYFENGYAVHMEGEDSFSNTSQFNYHRVDDERLQT